MDAECIVSSALRLVSPRPISSNHPPPLCMYIQIFINVSCTYIISIMYDILSVKFSFYFLFFNIFYFHFLFAIFSSLQLPVRNPFCCLLVALLTAYTVAYVFWILKMNLFHIAFFERKRMSSSRWWNMIFHIHIDRETYTRMMMMMRP